MMAALRALGSSIEDIGFDDAWVEAGIYGFTTKQQILKGNHMKRALTAHSMTYSALCDVHVEAFLKTEKEESGADFPSTNHAAYTMNATSQEGKYGEFGKHHQEILNAIKSEKFEEKIHDFDRKMEPQRPMFKLAKEYMKFVAFILMFLHATREGNWKLHLKSLILKALCKHFFAHDRLNKWNSSNRLIPTYIKYS